MITRQSVSRSIITNCTAVALRQVMDKWNTILTEVDYIADMYEGYVIINNKDKWSVIVPP